mmetsp:Transcript_8785/g.21632  ORF Transcript_8785/g.21632 Transcript_8785/m.21632 type:complete len:406 (+) Transcript_8785:334-1551(+)
MRYTNEWAVSDAIKAFISLVMFVYALWLLRNRVSSNSALRIIRWGSTVAWFLMIPFFVGAHEPARYGWRAYLINNAIVSVILLELLLYLSLVVSNAYYDATNNSKDIPSIGSTVIGMGMILVSLLMLIAVVMVLATDQLVFNSIRHGATAATIVIGGAYFTSSMFRLRSIILKSSRKLSKHSRDQFVQLQQQHKRGEPVDSKIALRPLNHDDSKAKNEKHNLELKGPYSHQMSNVMNHMSGYGMDGIESVNSHAALNQNPKFNQQNCPPSQRATIQEPASPSNKPILGSGKRKRPSAPASAKNSRNLSTNRESRGKNMTPSALNAREQIEKRVMAKICRMIIITVIIAPVLTFLLVTLIVSQFFQGGSYSDDNDIENEKYQPFLDATLYLVIVVNGALMYYAYGK